MMNILKIHLCFSLSDLQENGISLKNTKNMLKFHILCRKAYYCLNKNLRKTCK